MSNRCASCDRLARFVTYTEPDERDRSHRVPSCARHLTMHIGPLLSESLYVTTERPAVTESSEVDHG